MDILVLVLVLVDILVLVLVDILVLVASNVVGSYVLLPPRKVPQRVPHPRPVDLR